MFLSRPTLNSFRSIFSCMGIMMLLLWGCGGGETQDSTPEDTVQVQDSQPQPDTLPQEVPDKPEVVEVDTLSLFEQIFQDSGLVDMKSLDSTFVYDIKYSTEDNFLKYDVYEDYEGCYLRKEAADKLLKAQNKLREKRPGYRHPCLTCLTILVRLYKLIVK